MLLLKNYDRSCKALLLLVGITVSVAITIGAISSGEVYGKKIATLSGDQVVPPVITNAAGRATFKHPDSTTMNYKLNITGISNPTGVGVHQGKTGNNGDLIVDLMKHANNQTVGNALMMTGSFTASDLLGQMQGKTILDLVSAMKIGDTYLSVDTEKYPKGEIRGQIELANPPKPITPVLNQTGVQTN